MKFNQWTLGLAAAGVVSLGSVAQADEAKLTSLQTALSHTVLSGYVDTSAIWRFGNGSGNIPGRSYDGSSKQDGFNLNVVKLTLEKPLDEGQWAAGYKVDLLFGPDASTFNSTPGGANNATAIKQAYVALRAPVGNGLDFKIGVWDTIIGYEVFDAGNNPNYSRSYGYLLEPTTYTGILASYRVNDIISLSAGIANGNNAATSLNSRSGVQDEKSYMGSIALTAPKDWGFIAGSTLYAGVVDHGIAGAAGNIINFYAGSTVNTPVKGLSVGVAYDYSGQNKSTVNSQNAVGLYASFKATEKMTLNARGEYAWGTPGSFSSTAHPAGEEFIGLTGTLDYSLWANVVSRVEVRWDHDAHSGAGTPAFTGGGTGTNQKDIVSLALNVIYKF